MPPAGQISTRYSGSHFGQAFGVQRLPPLQLPAFRYFFCVLALPGSAVLALTGAELM
jgi:hypothetical protein